MIIRSLNVSYLSFSVKVMNEKCFKKLEMVAYLPHPPIRRGIYLMELCLQQALNL